MGEPILHADYSLEPGLRLRFPPPLALPVVRHLDLQPLEPARAAVRRGGDLLVRACPLPAAGAVAACVGLRRSATR